MQSLCVPFAWSSPYVDSEKLVPGSWEGSIETYQIAGYIENFLLLVLGGVPAQVKIYVFIKLYLANQLIYEFICYRTTFNVFWLAARQNKRKSYPFGLDS